MRIFVVDAFASRPFSGEPAGVCLLEGEATEAWMQSVAAELRHAETAFLERVGTVDVDYRLRWFTPTVEVPLCGHATLAAAHVLFDQGEPGPLRFSTLSGTLTAGQADDGFIELDFPADPPEPAAAPDGLCEALGVEPLWTGRSRRDVLVEVATQSEVRDLVPDLDAVSALEVGAIVTARAGGGVPYQFVSRYFAPSVGVPEAMVAGSAHCVLAPYWAGRLGIADGERLTGQQLSPRGASVTVAVHGDRVALAGRAVTVLSGTLLV